MLRHEVKEELLWSVDRTSPADKVRDFVERCRVIIADMDYLKRINELSFFTRLLVRFSRVWGTRLYLHAKRAGDDDDDERMISERKRTLWLFCVCFSSSLSFSHLFILLCWFLCSPSALAADAGTERHCAGFLRARGEVLNSHAQDFQRLVSRLIPQRQQGRRVLSNNPFVCFSHPFLSFTPSSFRFKTTHLVLGIIHLVISFFVFLTYMLVNPSSFSSMLEFVFNKLSTDTC
jgi:hypothetical protein